MSSSDVPEATAGAGSGEAAVLTLMWHFTETYRHTVALDAVAAAVGRTVDELAADPASLFGVAGHRLADLLTGHQTPLRTVGVAEVEIVGADYDASPTLAELATTARAAVHAEADTGRHTPAGMALAALLAGLRREGITDR
jgi:hypothetical protein